MASENRTPAWDHTYVLRQPTWALRSMIRALELSQPLNTPEEMQRLNVARAEMARREKKGWV